MKRNSRLSLALHTLAHMADDPGRMQTSAEIATHVGTNPVVVRRVLGRLREAGLMISEKGHAGGWRLARAPQDISLGDVYLALDERLLAAVDLPEPTDCAVEHALHKRVALVLDEAEQALVQRLSETTLSTIRES